MPEFLKLHTADEASKVFFEQLGKYSPKVESVKTVNAVGRVLAETIVANEYLPAFSRSSMDGYAVDAADTHGVSESLPGYLSIKGEVPMGSAPSFKLSRGEAALIHTGGMLPEGSNAVLILEQSHLTAQGELEIFKSISKGENVIFKGEDVKPGDEVLPAGKIIRPAEVGGLLALGHTQVNVAKKPLFAILSSGDEVISPEMTPKMGQVRDINSGALSALLAQCGAEYRLYPIIPDDREQMEQTIRLAYNESDAVVVTAGSSASSRDMTADAIQLLGKPGVLVHGINIRPGKPTILAVCDGKPVIGLPGNPISALVIATFYIKPLVNRMLGNSTDPILPMIKAILTVNVASQSGRLEWVPVRLIKKADVLKAEPIFFKSNLIFQLANADGLLKISPDETGKDANSVVDVLLI